MPKHAIYIVYAIHISVCADHSYRFQFLGVAKVMETIIMAEICVTRIIS